MTGLSRSPGCGETVAWTADGRGFVWSDPSFARTKRATELQRLPPDVRQLTFTADGSHLVAQGGGGVWLLDPAPDLSEWRLTGNPNVAASADGARRLWTNDEGELWWQADLDSAHRVEVAGSWDGVDVSADGTRGLALEMGGRALLLRWEGEEGPVVTEVDAEPLGSWSSSGRTADIEFGDHGWGPPLLRHRQRSGEAPFTLGPGDTEFLPTLDAWPEIGAEAARTEVRARVDLSEEGALVVAKHTGDVLFRVPVGLRVSSPVRLSGKKMLVRFGDDEVRVYPTDVSPYLTRACAMLIDLESPVVPEACTARADASATAGPGR
ncbi:MAG: hypothetical protein V4850_34920 [Myxococcota bacterium]